MRTLIVGCGEYKTIFMEGVNIVAHCKNKEVQRIERREDVGELIDKWLAAAKREPSARKQIIKLIYHKRNKPAKSGQSVLRRLQQEGKIVLSTVV